MGRRYRLPLMIHNNDEDDDDDDNDDDNNNNNSFIHSVGMCRM